MSYQSEERYWTDYLRIALPVVGLLLMLGLFWFWATSLIGDENDDDPNQLAEIPTATAPAPSPSPSPTGVAAGGTEAATGTETEPAAGSGDETEPATTDGDTAADGAIDDAAADGADTAATDEEEPADDEAPCDFDFCPGDSVTTSSDGVNFRAEPSTEEGVTIIDQFDEGVEFIVRDDDEPTDEGEIQFIPVQTSDGEQDGWIASDFLNPES